MKRFLAASLTLALGLSTAVLAQVTLKPRTAEGTATYVGSYSVDQTINLAGMDLTTKGDVTTTMTYVTGKPDAEGKVRIQERRDAMTASLSLPGGLSINYDSSKPETAKHDNPVLQGVIDQMASLHGKTYTRVVDKDNKIIALEGVEKIISEAPQAAQSELKNELSLTQLQRDWDQEIKRFPEGAVKVGDKWKRTEINSIGAGQTLTFTIFYEYLGTVEKNGKTYDKLGLFHESVQYAIAPNSALPLKVVNSDLKIESTLGTVLIDRERGESIESTQTVKIVGPMTFSINDMQIPGKLDLTMTTGGKKK